MNKFTTTSSIIIVIIVIVILISSFVFLFQFRVKKNLGNNSTEYGSEISLEELKVFFKKTFPIQPDNYVLEEEVFINFRDSIDFFISYLIDNVKMKTALNFYRMAEKGELRMRCLRTKDKDLSLLYLKNLDTLEEYACIYKRDEYIYVSCSKTKKDSEWKCERGCKIFFYDLNEIDFLKNIVIGNIKDLFIILTEEELYKILNDIKAFERKCIDKKCICVYIDAKNLLDETIKNKFNKYYIGAYSISHNITILKANFMECKDIIYNFVTESLSEVFFKIKTENEIYEVSGIIRITPIRFRTNILIENVLKELNITYWINEDKTMSTIDAFYIACLPGYEIEILAANIGKSTIPIEDIKIFIDDELVTTKTITAKDRATPLKNIDAEKSFWIIINDVNPNMAGNQAPLQGKTYKVRIVYAGKATDVLVTC